MQVLLGGGGMGACQAVANLLAAAERGGPDRFTEIKIQVYFPMLLSSFVRNEKSP